MASVGVFDGVHVAHLSILSELRSMAKLHRVDSVVFTILYPMEYYTGNFPGLLISPQERLAILQEMVDRVIFLDLTEISQLEPEEFFSSLKSMGMVGLVVGDDFRFGRDGRGDVETLKSLCSEGDIDLRVVEELRGEDGSRISSSLIRKLVMDGNVEKAMEYLGRPFTISGRVYHDLGLGRKLGFPTANLDRGHEILVKPRSGVYFSRTKLPDGRILYSVTSIGTRPTIGGDDVVRYETHILDFDGDLYGKRIEVELLSFMREEKKFSGVDELVDAIRLDVERAKGMVIEWSKKL